MRETKRREEIDTGQPTGLQQEEIHYPLETESKYLQ